MSPVIMAHCIDTAKVYGSEELKRGDCLIGCLKGPIRFLDDQKGPTFLIEPTKAHFPGLVEVTEDLHSAEISNR